MKKNKESKSAENVESVVAKETPSTTSTASTVPEVSKNGAAASSAGDQANIIEIGTWPPASTASYPLTGRMVIDLCELFFPRRDLIDLATAELKRNYAVFQDEAHAIAVEIVGRAIEYLSSQKNDQAWKDRFSVIFGGSYPEKANEIWCNNRLSQRRYPKKPAIQDIPFTFRSNLYEPIPPPKGALKSKLAPALHMIEWQDNGKPKVVGTAESERFLNGERKAIPKSSLYEREVFNRPIYRQVSGWEPYKETWLPRKSSAVSLFATSSDPALLKRLAEDLHNTFAWADESSFANYCSFLLQPMVCHIFSGQNPSYFALGPSQAGKGFLTSVLPRIIYYRPGDSTVSNRKLPCSTYELDVLIESVRNALFINFDEIKNASDEEMKLIDALTTQRMVPVRKFRHGYYEIDNHFTISLTAVHRTFSDETNGRLAFIKLKESRPEAITSFYLRWRKLGPDLLHAFFTKLNTVNIDSENLPMIPNRRPGFSLMAYITKEMFGVQSDFSLETNNSEILDDICKLFEESPHAGDIRGPWKRYTPRIVASFLGQNGGFRWRRETLVAALNTALGYTSTKNHPIYREVGYPSESGRRFHIESREEGQVNKRTFIYVQALEGAPNESR